MEENLKQLLLKDLCSRLPYGVMVKTPYNNAELIGINGIVRRKGYTKGTEYIDVITDKQTYPIRYVTPYLRPISSMTEEEKEELVDFGLAYWDNGKYTDKNGNTIIYGGKEIQLIPDIETYDWLNGHHFDYRNLIERGLAIDCTNLNVY